MLTERSDLLDSEEIGPVEHDGDDDQRRMELV